MKYVYGVYGGPSGVSPHLFGLYPSLPEARKNYPDMEGDEERLEVLYIAKLPLGNPIDYNKLETLPFDPSWKAEGGDWWFVR